MNDMVRRLMDPVDYAPMEYGAVPTGEVRAVPESHGMMHDIGMALKTGRVSMPWQDEGEAYQFDGLPFMFEGLGNHLLKTSVGEETSYMDNLTAGLELAPGSGKVFGAAALGGASLAHLMSRRVDDLAGNPMLRTAKGRRQMGGVGSRMTPAGTPAYLPETTADLRKLPDPQTQTPQIPYEAGRSTVNKKVSPELPKRTSPKLAERLDRIADPARQADADAAAQRGIEMGGDVWYNIEPLREQFILHHGPEEGTAQFNRFVDSLMATSPGSKVQANLARASLMHHLDNTAPNDAVTQAIRSGTQPPEVGYKGYGHLAHKTHMGILDNVDNPMRMLEQPKVSRYGEGFRGNYDNVVADRHFGRGIGWLQEGEDHIPATMYGYLEDAGRAGGSRLGVAPMQYQAGLWMGKADETNVANAQTMMEAFNDSLAHTAAKRGMDQGALLPEFIRGNLPLIGVAK